MTMFENAVDRRVWRAHRRRGRDWNRFDNRGRSPVGRLIVGSLIALWGFSLLLANLGFGDLRRVWPAVMVVVGVTLLIHRDPSRNHYGFWGTVWMAAGVLLYAAQQTWVQVSFWPVMLIVVGALFVYRGLTHTGK
jgi:cell wall-active antibiotic response 4TMS protein YvqF